MHEGGTEAVTPEVAGTPQQTGANAGRWRQHLSTAIVSLVGVSAGAVSGWASPMLVTLKSPSSPVGPMGLTEMSLLETLPTLASIVAIYLYGGTLDLLGRKWTGYLAAAPFIVGSVFNTCATLPYHIYIGRSLQGLGVAGMSISGPSLLSEVVHSSRRGAALTYSPVVTNLATLLIFVQGEFLSYRAFNICSLLVTMWFPLFFYFLPESPYYLASKKKNVEAHKSLLWYRGGMKDVADEEMKAVMSVSRQNAKFTDIFKLRSSRRAVVIVSFMFSFQQLGGSAIIVGYSSLMFDELDGFLSPMTSLIIMTSVKLLSSYFCSFIVDRMSRRFLLISTFLAMSITLTVISICYYFSDHLNPPDLAWILLGGLCIYFLSFGVGIGTLPGVIGNEIVVPEIKGSLSMITGTITLVAMTLCLQAYPFVNQYIGTYANFAIAAVINLIGCLISYILIPETRGIPLADIIEQLDR
ncbi:transporter [Nesidiocoris tenuis]|uniref:Transporter n=1 Tax=Nesidiocoris tenuis TaxID=355587 RepID=A0ABN7AB72_9HEMI|nr:transporter [Nesidiocoris tenuis]